MLWATFAALNLFHAVHQARQHHYLTSAYLLMVAIVLAFDAVLFILRGPAVARHAGLWPQLVAIVATWIVIPLTAMRLTWTPNWLLAATTCGLIALYGFVFWALLTLRRSFSITPEARKLVQRGPYALVRHPLYAAYIPLLILLGLPRFSFATVAIVAIGISGLVARTRYEEAVLRSVFSEYASYAAVTPRFFPSLMGRRRSRSTPLDWPIGPRDAAATDLASSI
jgi:protein-S-isoprenylcysteine O-methyltransferase Ste14